MANIDYEELIDKTINDLRQINIDVVKKIQNYDREVCEAKIALLTQHLYYWNPRSTHRHKKEQLINASQKYLHQKIKVLSLRQIKRSQAFLLGNEVISSSKGTYSKDKRRNSYVVNEDHEIAQACSTGRKTVLYTFTYDYFKKRFPKPNPDPLNSAIMVHHFLHWANKATRKHDNKMWFNKSARELTEELPWMKQRSIYSILNNIVEDELFFVSEGLYSRNMLKLSYTPNFDHPIIRMILINDKLRKEYKETLKASPKYNGFDLFIQTCNNFPYIQEICQNLN
jgi:hypothetical protein